MRIILGIEASLQHDLEKKVSDMILLPRIVRAAKFAKIPYEQVKGLLCVLPEGRSASFQKELSTTQTVIATYNIQKVAIGGVSLFLAGSSVVAVSDAPLRNRG